MQYAIITSCSKKKANICTRADLLYQGQFFKGVKQFANKNQMQLFILSAKYGIIMDETKICPYEQKLRNKQDVKKIKIIAIPIFEHILKIYDKILLIMGNLYRLVFSEFLIRPEIIIFEDNRGSGGFNQLIQKLNSLSRIQVEEILKNKRISINDLVKII